MDKQEDDDDEDSAVRIVHPEAYLDIKLPEDDDEPDLSSPAAASAAPAAASAAPAAASAASAPPPPRTRQPPPRGGVEAETRREEAMESFVAWIDKTMVAHDAWAQLVVVLLHGLAMRMYPRLPEGWQLAPFGSHHYRLSLPDSDLDVQLQVRALPPGLTSTDVTMAIGQGLRGCSWPAVSGASDSAIKSHSGNRRSGCRRSRFCGNGGHSHSSKAR